ncbi:MAG: L-aspartate oxidase [Pelosinus sp.]|nr:L-aspartate oxidase [Pelosinus sp.]
MREYLVSNEEITEDSTFDVVVIGAGIAGMTAALSIDPKLKVALVSKAPCCESSTYKAQGGMAVAVGADDSISLHIADTLRVGQGVCCEEAVEVLTGEGPKALEYLKSLSAVFSHNDQGLDLTREGGHSRSRVVHYYDYTGKYIAELLDNEVSKRSNICCIIDAFLIDILTDEGSTTGCIIKEGNRLAILKAGAVVIATGGYSGLFARSTNALSSNGDGIAAAYRAGAAIADMEFVQFHPTAFTTLSGKVFLLTEALRGEGAFLRNAVGERFMLNYHASADLAPRDVVSRAILKETQRQRSKAIFLDARHLGRMCLMNRFKQVYAELARNNIAMEQELIPIAPAAHYTIGGIRTDLWGKTNIAGLYACGEAAATGVHGANRLASNSLLEGIVFGRRAAKIINGGTFNTRLSSFIYKSTKKRQGSLPDISLLRDKLEDVAGVARRGQQLKETLNWLQDVSVLDYQEKQAYRVKNAYQLAKLLVQGALMRQESRGGHYRYDFPEKDDSHFKKHIIQQWGMEAMVQ